MSLFLRLYKNLFETNVFFISSLVFIFCILTFFSLLLQKGDVSDNPTIDVLFVVFCLTLCGLALANRHRIEKDQLANSLALSSLPTGLAVASLLGGGVALVSTGLIFQNGFDGLLPSLSLVGGLILFSCLFGSETSSFEAKTLPHFLGLRFGQGVRGVTLFISVFSTFGLLLVTFASCSAFISRFFSLSPDAASGITAVVVGFVVMPSGMRSAFRISAVLYSFFVLYSVGLFAFLAFDLYGYLFPQMGIFSALKDLSSAEDALVEKGGIDFGLFKPFLKEFLLVDRRNWVLIGLSSIASLSVLPPLFQITASGRSELERRKTFSWALCAVVLPLTALPLAAAITRLEVDRCVFKGTSFSELPRWIILASDRDLVSIHGVSLSLVKKVGSVVSKGAQNLKDIERAMVSTGIHQSQNWMRLDETVQNVLFDVARKNSLASVSYSSHDQLEKDFLTLVLPVAAKAAGNVSETITYSALSLHFSGILLALPYFLPKSVFLRALMAISLIGVGFGCLASLTATLTTMIVHDGRDLFPPQKSLSASQDKEIRHWNGVILVLLALLSSMIQIPSAFLFVGSLSLLAVSLFPAVLLRGCGARVNAIGCLAAMGVGLGVFIYYFLGTSMFSVTFYEKWFWLSNGGLEGYAEFGELKSSWVEAEGEAKDSLFREMHLLTTGSLWSPGLANWLGIAPASAAVISIPLATLTGFIVSLLTHKLTFIKKAAI